MDEANVKKNAEDPFRAFLEQVDDLTFQSFEDGTVAVDILANVASSLWTFPHTAVSTTNVTKYPAAAGALFWQHKESLSSLAASSTKEKPAAGPTNSSAISTCDDCGASLLHVNSLSRIRIERTATSHLTRTQRRRDARRRKATQNDLWCCKTVQIHTCYRCDAKFKVPAVRNPRPQRKRNLVPRHTPRNSKHQQPRQQQQQQATPKNQGILHSPAKTPPQQDQSSPQEQVQQQRRTLLPSQQPPMLTTLDNPKKKKRNKTPPKNSLMEFLSSLNDGNPR